MKRRVAVALVHSPVLGKDGRVITSTITNLDVHDISRTARTYGLNDFFIVHPTEAQRSLVARIVDHWTRGSSAERIPDRKDALALVRTVATLEDVYATLGGRAAIRVWVTSARALRNALTFTDARASLETEGPPVLILFGTSWGLTEDVVDAADHSLVPIAAARETGFNHLSVRAACAVTLDRLLGGA